MVTRTTLLNSVVVTLVLAHPAARADKLSPQTLTARIAAKPTGADAQSLADEIRTWFGKDRAGKNNVIDGANPKVEQLETAWAIEAPEAKTAVVSIGDGKSLPLTQIGDTPVFAASISAAGRVGISLVVCDRRNTGAQKGSGRSIHRSARPR